MSFGRKQTVEVVVQLCDTKVAAEDLENPETGNGVSAGFLHLRGRKSEATQLVLRFLSLVTSVVSVTTMATAEELGILNVFGLQMPLYAKWSLSDTFEYLLFTSTVVAIYSLVILIISLLKFRTNSPPIPTRRAVLVIFTADQVFTYLMLSACSATAGAANFRRMGIQQTVKLPNICEAVPKFCSRIGISMASVLLNSIILGICAIFDISCLVKFQFFDN